MSIDIVLATYNGEAFLAAQMDSILAQREQNWRLLIRDDGSTDGTKKIIGHYIERDPKRIQHVEDGGKRLGAKGNFGALLAATDADYVMCADQDDVWLPNKISRTLADMRNLEKAYGKNAPLLVHTDSILTDAKLNTIAPSCAKYNKLHPEHATLNRLLVQNTAQGCTMMLNRALVKAALPIPEEARGHDAWLALVATALGYVSYLPESTLYYRQHAANAIGGGKKTWAERMAKIGAVMKESIEQALALKSQCGNELPETKRALLERFISLPTQKGMARKWALLKGGYLRQPLWHNAAMLLWK